MSLYKEQVNYESCLCVQLTGTKTEDKLRKLLQKDGSSFSNVKCELKELSQPTAVQNNRWVHWVEVLRSFSDSEPQSLIRMLSTVLHQAHSK
jgi:hypothetical protein